MEALLSGGQAYEHATSSFLGSFDNRPVLRDRIVSVYADSLKLMWEVAVAMSGLGFSLVFVEKQVELRTNMETEFGLQEKENSTGKA